MLCSTHGTAALLPCHLSRRLRRTARLPLLLAAVVGAPGCKDSLEPTASARAAEERDLNVTARPALAAGSALPGMDLGVFAEGREAFADVESIEDGLGPTFNDRACGNCHTTPAVGGSGEQIERRFGRIDGRTFYGFDQDEDNQGGTLRQLFSNGAYTFEGKPCSIAVEVEPTTATVRDVGRRTTALFGLGLVDAMPDRFFESLAASQPRSIRGVARKIPVVLPDPRDPSQSLGSTGVGRFGWKGLVPSLLVFAGDAYDNEMGITTQSCSRGTSVLEFAVENLPNNIPAGDGCNGGDLVPAHPADPDVPPFVDDAVGSCASGRTEIQEDLADFTSFMEALAPPPRDLSGDRYAIRFGEDVFKGIGCAGCHVATTFVTPPRPFNGVPGRYPFRPYSDFLAHDMGSLGDRIGQTGDPLPQTRLMRTQPLWGARYNTSYLHDGRAADIPAAILAHDGQGAAARDAFRRLGLRARAALVAFVLSL